VGDQQKPAKGQTWRVMAQVVSHPRAGVGALIWIYTLGMMAFMAMNAVLALYLERTFGINEETIGWFFVYVGGVSLVMRTLVLGPAVRRFGETEVMRIGALSMAVSLALLPLCRNLFELAFAVLLMPVGTALLFPTTTSLVSRRAPADQTGLVLGVQQSFGGVARMIGPIWAGVVFQHVGIRSPFFIAAGVMLFVRLFAATVRRGRGGEAGGSEATETRSTES
jgi:predicted MFS family arabinose efflux permease